MIFSHYLWDAKKNYQLKQLFPCSNTDTFSYFLASSIYFMTDNGSSFQIHHRPLGEPDHQGDLHLLSAAVPGPDDGLPPHPPPAEEQRAGGHLVQSAVRVLRLVHGNNEPSQVESVYRGKRRSLLTISDAALPIVGIFPTPYS